ncbi:MAG: hypothetical protein MRERV_18c013 [Mycoplasmataceae bacterium RV_VA103A]|nr:MAG: hypothetical protein MRERV_18c013 [Mycoplasmataceae bacterium RV_VA103A]
MKDLQEFKNWLNQVPSRKQNLPSWEKFFTCFLCFYDSYYWSIDVPKFFKVIEEWEEKDGDFKEYWNICYKYSGYGETLGFWGNAYEAPEIIDSIWRKKQELNQIKQEKQELETKITQLKQDLTNKEQELDTYFFWSHTYKYIAELSEAALIGEDITAVEKRAIELKQGITERTQDSFSQGEITQAYEKIDGIVDLAKQRGEVEGQLKEKERELVELREELVVKTQAEEELIKELEQLKQEKRELEGKLSQSETSLTKTRQELDKWKKELGDKEQEFDALKVQLEQKTTNQQDLEQQLSALALSSGLLSQQVEQLTSQLSEKEQEVEQKRLEAEVKANLLREQNEKINQQTNQLTNYQNLLRKAEENLKKAQGLIQQKEKKLEELEKEKNLIGEELREECLKESN